ncbi:hypothetical protein HB771_17265 [Rhizobium leguminosarum bv. viciae]|nr:hypothetical protein HB771_17265 [Rhizobium leguminosarum bv. viciae]
MKRSGSPPLPPPAFSIGFVKASEIAFIIGVYSQQPCAAPNLLWLAIWLANGRSVFRTVIDVCRLGVRRENPSHTFCLLVAWQPEISAQSGSIRSGNFIIDRVPFAQNPDGFGEGGRCGHLLAFGLPEPAGRVKGKDGAEGDGGRQLYDVGD